MSFHPLALVDVVYQSPARRGGGLRIELIRSAASGRTPALHIVATTVAGGREYSVIVNPRHRLELREAVEHWIELCDAHERGQASEVV